MMNDATLPIGSTSFVAPAPQSPAEAMERLVDMLARGEFSLAVPRLRDSGSETCAVGPDNQVMIFICGNSGCVLVGERAHGSGPVPLQKAASLSGAVCLGVER